MATNEENWIGDIINDFIHSSIWLSPIQTFIDTNCACFDYDDDEDELLIEQKNIYKQYEKLVNSLILSLSEDLKLDFKQLQKTYEKSNYIIIDESYEQLYAANDFNLFSDIMKKKNLILQLQALVNLQLECGLLRQTETNDDRVLQLLLQATSSTPSKKTPTKNSPDLKQQSRTEMKKVEQHKEVQSKEIEPTDEPKTIDAIPEEVLREKLRELTISTPSSVVENNAAAMMSRQNFLKEQRDLIINKQRNERARELEKEIVNARPQSAARVARKAMETVNKPGEKITNDELEKRRAMAAKLRREVVDKQ